MEVIRGLWETFAYAKVYSLLGCLVFSCLSLKVVSLVGQLENERGGMVLLRINYHFSSVGKVKL